MTFKEDSYTTKEVAELLGITERTVRNYCKKRLITHYVISTKIYIKKDDLNKFIESQKNESKGDLNNEKGN